MVKHKKFQNYKRHYGTTCITGILGCRWHRYQQSTRGTGKAGMAWFTLLIFTMLMVTFMLYYWILAANSSDDFSWHLYELSGNWWPVYTIAFSLTCVVFAYVFLLFVLTLCHISLAHQIYISWLHRVLLMLIVAGCVSIVIVMSDLWREGWQLQYISLMITAPFLHLSAVFVMTCMSWFIAERWMLLEGVLCRVTSLTLYLSVMLFLYLSPLLIDSPCICEKSDLPSKPVMFAHRGASAIAPENTIEAFRLADNYEGLYAFESDVSISYDGVPFLMHDRTLTRTTNVKDVFPDRAASCSCMFTISELKQLNAGSWFLQTDPFGTVSSLSESTKETYSDLEVPTFTELLDFVAERDGKLLFDLIPYELGIPRSHPYAANFTDVVVETITNHPKVKQENVYWLYRDVLNTTVTNNLTIMYGKSHNNEDLLEIGGVDANIPFQRTTLNSFRDLLRENVTVNVWVVNSDWLYSLYWCMGVPSVTTNYVHHFSTLSQPVWNLTPSEFQIMWITTDIVSFSLLIVVFVIQRLRKGIPKKYSPEVVTLHTAKQHIQNKRYNRYMKEKLIYAGEGLQEVEHGIVGGVTTIDNPECELPSHRYSLNNSFVGDFDEQVNTTESAVTAAETPVGSVVRRDDAIVNGKDNTRNSAGFGTVVIDGENETASTAGYGTIVINGQGETLNTTGYGTIVINRQDETFGSSENSEKDLKL